jgi:hypothetical protein
VKNSSGAIPSLLKKSEMSPTQKKPELTDKDFPPLGLLKGEQKAGCGYCGDRQTTKNESEAIDELVHFIRRDCLMLTYFLSSNQTALDWFDFSSAFHFSYSSRVHYRDTDPARNTRGGTCAGR